jgi:hypothetical protein
VTAYVPPTAFGRTLGDLDRIGHARMRHVTGQDVGEEFVDLVASRTQISSSIDFSKKKRRLAVPWPVCTLRLP